MKALFVGCAFGLLALCTSSAVAAPILDIVLTGDVGQLTDPSGYFGDAKAGDSFKLTYQVNFNKGALRGFAGSFTEDSQIIGGSSLPAEDSEPTLLISPIAADLDINKRNFYFSGQFLASLDYVQEGFGYFYGDDEGTSNSIIVVQDEPNLQGQEDQITTNVQTDNYKTFPLELDTPLYLPVDGVNTTGTSEFMFSDGRGYSVAGMLNPTLYQAIMSAAPEPSSWIMLMIGTALTGGVLRRRSTAFKPVAHTQA